jgi:hypothetical protein
MSKYKLGDILAGKKPGDEWFCLAAPERVWVWIKKSPWPKTLVDKAESVKFFLHVIH